MGQTINKVSGPSTIDYEVAKLKNSALASNSKPTLERAGGVNGFSAESIEMASANFNETGQTNETAAIGKDSFESTKDMLAGEQNTNTNNNKFGNQSNSTHTNAFITTF